MAEKKEKSSLYGGWFKDRQAEQDQIKKDAWHARQIQEEQEKRAAKKKLELQKQLQMQMEMEYLLQQRHQFREMMQTQMGAMFEMLSDGYDEDGFQRLPDGYDNDGFVQPSVDINTYSRVMKKLKNVPTNQLETVILQFRLSDAARTEILTDITLEREENIKVKVKKTEAEEKETNNQVEKVEKILTDITCNDNTECSICLDVIDDCAKGTPCGHTFHHDCIIDWVKVKPLCPVCKFDFIEPIETKK